MARIVLGLVAVIACFMLVDSLTCKKCSLSVFGFCLNSDTVTCDTNVTNCFTGKATFPSVPSFSGFNSQGCLALAENAGCNKTTNDTLLGFEYKVQLDCCTSDECNPVNTSDAPVTKLTFTAAIAAALLASVCGSMQ
ncbi:unnamed protein product [Pleuronectes platessa]|uniref:UPAR/Ly6 domain-containing protein n=1 Tax=Pleuronectes platessa TaxID=8262 RepID=A0A9N7YTH0_PLEPL|nr:unnamed protein product [Pleuronectes platessa]